MVVWRNLEKFRQPPSVANIDHTKPSTSLIDPNRKMTLSEALATKIDSDDESDIDWTSPERQEEIRKEAEQKFLKSAEYQQILAMLEEDRERTRRIKATWSDDSDSDSQN
jgi:hypothetical protein